METSRVIFFERQFPSANMMLVWDQHPMLIDPGFISDVKDTEQLIRDAGFPPEQLALIVNTHYHTDHVGGNHYFQNVYGTPVAAHKWDAHLINTCDPEACSAEWLNQPVESYCVDRPLTDNDEIVTGEKTWQVLHTPGHTLGHISLYDPDNQLLIAGDLFQKYDVGWINIFREGVASVQLAIESLDRLSKLPMTQVYSGHGPPIENPQVCLDAARNRFEKWLKYPEKISWHACKRIFAVALMNLDGLAEEEIASYLLSCGWFQDFARYTFELQPEEFIPVLLEEMIRSGAAHWQEDHLIATTPYKAPKHEWLNMNTRPKDWIRHDKPLIKNL